MYAEVFGVNAKLEEPAKWLQWAQGSLQAGKTDEAKYNLQQFWKSLEPFKAKAASYADWAGILFLDASSQSTLGNLLGDTPEGAAAHNAAASLGEKAANASRLAQDPNSGTTTPQVGPVESMRPVPVSSHAPVVSLPRISTPSPLPITSQRQAYGVTPPKYGSPAPQESGLAGIPIWVWIAGGLAAVLLLMPQARALVIPKGAAQ